MREHGGCEREKVVDGERQGTITTTTIPKHHPTSLHRIAVVGNVDAGKSTLLGVLTHVDLDNGRGQARQKLFRHKHEMESGRTSSVSNDILGFDCHGNVVNKPEHGSLDWVRICQKSAKVPVNQPFDSSHFLFFDFVFSTLCGLFSF